MNWHLPWAFPSGFSAGVILFDPTYDFLMVSAGRPKKVPMWISVLVDASCSGSEASIPRV